MIRRGKAKRRKLTGFDIGVPYVSANFKALADGMVMWIKNSRIKSVNSTFVLIKSLYKTKIFTSLYACMNGLNKYEISGCSFIKLVKCSRLTKNKLMKMRFIK